MGGILTSAGWLHWSIDGLGEVSALETDTADRQVLLQLCDSHYRENAPSSVPREWEVFDPDRHAYLIKPPLYRWTPTGLVTTNLGPINTEPECATEEAMSPAFTALAESLPPEIEAAMLLAVTPDEETAIYRWYDDADKLLYVGITDDLRVRTASHFRGSSWTDFAARATVARFPTRWEAEEAERAAIQSEKPLFNWQHADIAEAGPRLVAYLVEKGRLDLLAPAVSRG